MRVAEVAGVGEHQGRVALVPERAVVGAADVVDEFGQANGEERKSCRALKAAAELPAKPP